MSDPHMSTSNQTSPSTTTRITDLNVDSLAHCLNRLNLRDISNLAMTCKSLKSVSYSDSIWLRFFREQWPNQLPCNLSQRSGFREAYLARHTALQQFKFVDPVVEEFHVDPKPNNQLLLDKNEIIFSQGSIIYMVKIDDFLRGRTSLVTLSDHNARITCMRLFPLFETSLFRSETQREENILVTSSCDHSIRLWWKGSCQRCFRGHNGPVSTLSDKMLGDGSGKVFASGGEDGTVRLWSLSSGGKRGQKALKTTLYGHEKPVKFMVVAGHRTSLLATISTDSKVRVWDTTASSAIRSSCCVGMTSVPGAPVGMKCHESLLYVAAGSSVVTVDLRTMQKVMTAAVHQQKLHSFNIIPSKSLICCGGNGKAMLWDVRRNQDVLKPEPLTELDGHTGPVTQLHMDPYKIVTGGPEDPYVNIWEADSGKQTNSLACCLPERLNSKSSGCSAVAVKGYRIVTTSCDEELGLLRFRDYTNATCPVSAYQDKPSSKFWDSQSCSETDSSDEEAELLA